MSGNQLLDLGAAAQRLKDTEIAVRQLLARLITSLLSAVRLSGWMKDEFIWVSKAPDPVGGLEPVSPFKSSSVLRL